jgi:hypothetical protein
MDVLTVGNLNEHQPDHLLRKRVLGQLGLQFVYSRNGGYQERVEEIQVMQPYVGWQSACV